MCRTPSYGVKSSFLSATKSKSTATTPVKAKPTAKTANTPRPTAKANPQPKTKATAPTKTKPKGKRDYGSTEKNLAAWAKANPALAIRLEDKKKAKAQKRAGGTLYSGRTGMSKMG